jgi:hypothetical protein
MHYKLTWFPHGRICGWLLVFVCLLLPHAAWSAEEGRANLTIIPGRVIIDTNNPYPSVMLKNSGKARGDYNIELVDMVMSESGDVMPLSSGKTVPYSARPYLHVSPRSVSLAPGEVKRLQLVLRKPPNLEPGEYRAHLKMRLVNDEAGKETEGVRSGNDKSVSIAVKANVAVIIPVIWRHGETNYTIQLESPALARDADGAPLLDMYLKREGNRSSMNDISIDYISPEGKSQTITFFPGVPVYREVSRRFISIPLDVPKGVDLSTGSLKISCLKQEDEGAAVMSEKILPLQR